MTTSDELVLAHERDPAELRRARRDGALERVRRGAYRPVPADGTHASGPTAATRLALARATAVHRQLRSRHVFSHETAALLWGAPLWRAPDRVHVRVRSRPSGRSAPDVARHTGLPTHERLLQDLPATDLLTTVVDCALTLPPLDALVVADWALRAGMDRGRALALLAEPRRRNGTARARRVLAAADGGAESAWETWARYLALRAGLPPAVTQLPVQTPHTLYRVDLGWPEHRVLVEFDGRVKYTDGAFGRGYDADRVRFEDKVREDAITATTGVRPLRLTARDGVDPQRATRLLLQQFGADVVRSSRVDPLLPWPTRA
ncbi:hypothetical protein ACNHYB_11805 [Isoptericola jiangsuensis]|uniref:hypothetical protein n=1 Tax=Isoptericola jiangsuensis TaxID=548579 RepID=UPI003AAEE26C